MIADAAKEKENQRRMNRITLNKLSEAGSNLSLPHPIVNVFHVYEQATLAGLQLTLERNGLVVTDPGSLHHYEGHNYWKCEATIKEIPTLRNIDALTDKCVNLAAIENVEYDGWYTQVQ